MTEARPHILVSACLLGQPVRHDGRAALLRHPLLAQWIEQGRVVAICPEMAGGQPTPRPAAELCASSPGLNPGPSNGTQVQQGLARVVDRAGRDLTAPYLRGAQQAVALAQHHGITVALLKDGSPSCGSTRVHDGRFEGTLRDGHGVTAAALRAAAVRVFSEAQIDDAARALQLQDAQAHADPKP